MKTKLRALSILSTMAVLATWTACGDERDDAPATGPSDLPLAVGLPPAGLSKLVGADLTSVGLILADPNGFLGSEVTLQGTIQQVLGSGRFLFGDGTGEIPADFDPTGALPQLDQAIALTGTVASSPSPPGVVIDVSSWQMLQAFSCDDIIEVRARFSSPGFAFGNVVGLFLGYRGVPPGKKTLKMTWDVHQASGAVEEFELGAGVLREDGFFDLEGVVPHEYPDVRGPENKQVRAELFIDGRLGACSRVRDIDVSPGSGPGFAGGGTISMSIDQENIFSEQIFSIRARVNNKATATVNVEVLFQTPQGAGIEVADGMGCKVLDAKLVECKIDGLAAGEVVTRVVGYRAPQVDQAVELPGAVALVSGEFSPVVPYRVLVQPLK